MTETLRVDICYRPLRIGWAIQAGDFAAFRKAARFSNALWGGRYNPILVVDHEDEASQLVDLFRLDIILPIGEGVELQSFAKKHSYLINPFRGNAIFHKGSEGYHPYAEVLDVYNALAHLRDRPEWNDIRAKKFRLYTWNSSDPLSDVFLSQLGAYPDPTEIGADYRALVMEAAQADEVALVPAEPVPADVIDHPSIPYLSRHGLKRHHSVRSGWSSPGFFVGSGADLDDLVCHWNLRACDIPLWFVDPQYLSRFASLIPVWEKAMRDHVANFRSEWDRKVAIWTRRKDLDEASKPFGNGAFMRCCIQSSAWNGLNICPPMMYLGEASVLGVLSTEGTMPQVSFALSEKPFCTDNWFYQQHLAASVSIVGGLSRDEQHTLHPPYVPELNEFYARTMHFHYDKLRIEPDRIGLIVGVGNHDSFLYALPMVDLMERIFGLAGYKAKLSSAGLISRQLIARLGGLQGARVFKVPGVRRLLRTHGPNASITRRTALQTIGSTDPDRPGTKFDDHEDLHIEQRPWDEKLTPAAVFGFLVGKGLFRIGAELNCPSCRMSSWVALDALKQRVACELCGYEHEVTRQLTDRNEWHFRRSGILGAERNALGAVPVSLTLQQLDTCFHAGLQENMYSPSLDLIPKDGVAGTKCEVDFVWVMTRTYPDKAILILGECKDHGPITSDDVANLKRIAEAIPATRFETFVLLSQISPFTDGEIETARTLNDEYRRRAILFTARELEPYFIYERTKKELGIEGYGGSPENMAEVTAKIYFNKAAATEDGPSPSQGVVE